MVCKKFKSIGRCKLINYTIHRTNVQVYKLNKMITNFVGKVIMETDDDIASQRMRKGKELKN